ncbi:MAG: YkoP family protein [Candidatus Dormibacteraceae bacterium]
MSRWSIRELPWAVMRLGRAGSGRAAGLIAVWAGWEHMMIKRYPSVAAREGALFRYRLERYRGPWHRLGDGTVIRPGDSIVELHFDNRALLALRKVSGYSTWKAVHELRQDLSEIESRLASGQLGPAVALHGVSLMGMAGGLLGLESNELPHDLGHALQRYFLAGLDAVYHPSGLERLGGRARVRWPAEVWLSAEGAARLTAKP